LVNGSCREKDEVTKLETEVSGEYLSRHFKEGKFAAEGTASDALGKNTKENITYIAKIC
jgi:hypothetical protein